MTTVAAKQWLSRAQSRESGVGWPSSCIKEWRFLCRWREEGKSGSGSILDWRSWRVFPSRYVMFQDSAAAGTADREPEELPKLFLQVGLTPPHL